jgi:hypothetical protein
MNLLTPFLTVLRINRATQALVHRPAWLPGTGEADFSVDLPAPLTKVAEVAGLPGFTAVPGALPGMLRLVRGAETVWAHPARDEPFLRGPHDGVFEFLLVAEADLANLRTLFAHSWTLETEEATPVGGEDFTVDFGRVKVDLRRGMPRAVGERFEFITDFGVAVVAPRGAARREILLRRLAAYRRPAVGDDASFRAETNRALKLPGAAEILALPMTVRSADRDWMYENPEGGHEQHVGRHRFSPSVTRARDKFVLLARHVEGMVFDADGVFTEIGYLDNLGSGGGRHLPVPAGMRQEGERMFVSRDALAAAPLLPGPHVVFYVGNLSNYTHWLIDGMLPLHVLLPHVPAAAKLLMPGTLRRFAGNPVRICDHYDVMRACGFGNLAMVEIDAPYCRVEEVYWLDNGWINNMPAEHLRGLRARVMSARKPTPGGDVNIYIERRGTRRIAEPGELARFLARQGFETYSFDTMSVDEQIDLFARAKWVVGAHGAELGNLLFCRPGTKVLELAPASGFKPYYSYMCNKLALVHGILPCTTKDGGFHGDMTVDMERFVALFRMLKHHF